MKKTLMVAVSLVMVLALVIGFSGTVFAKPPPPKEIKSQGAYVKLEGNVASGDVKIKYGWNARTPASAAVGYHVGLYDVGNSHYEWDFDTLSLKYPVPDLGCDFRTNLPPGDYKIVFHVRSTYSPPDNITTIELPFTVPVPVD